MLFTFILLSKIFVLFLHVHTHIYLNIRKKLREKRFRHLNNTFKNANNDVRLASMNDFPSFITLAAPIQSQFHFSIAHSPRHYMSMNFMKALRFH